ncbi:glycosyltransferase family 2 protein [Eggerthella sinensis]|jgi:glycosyltransferase involved in cell wall biosynthesis|uniref:glycosyltransferase family 2 protein n=2 Tax=Eggerthella sinensis TaxID=242230 RepID=UPI001D075967|nr:glycosyltransferase family 2 protein [Eggerthella sinensis]MCB7038001.1 glycosyltransferase family 2 protein [Eggerthella sinensis]
MSNRESQVQSPDGILDERCSDMIERTLIVIPAYNEESSLLGTLDELLSTIPTCHYLVVNDGSRDGTEAICREQGFNHISLPVNVGLSGAFQAGIKFAYENGYDFVLQFDADGQHDPRFIPSILQQAADHDIVIGSRFVTEKKPFSLRMVGSALITTAIRMTSGVHLKDPTSGMRLFGKKSMRAFANDSNCGPEPDTLAYFIKKKEASVVEVPVTMRDRMAGTSYLNAKAAILYMLRMTVSIVIIQPFRR